MDILKILLLSIVQGITELLPVSSSAHLILVSKIIDIDIDTYFLTILHLGTSLAILIYFFQVFFKDIFSKEKLTFYIKILVAAIPAGIVGLLLEEYIENILRSNIYIAISLLFWGIIMIVAERKEDKKEVDVEKVSFKQSFFMGIAQIFALIPGTSRSGITTIAGILSGLDKYTALQYSFLIGLPILIGASGYELIKYDFKNIFFTEYILGILVSGVIGYIALKILEKVKKKNWLTVFGIYRIILGLLILITIL